MLAGHSLDNRELLVAACYYSQGDQGSRRKMCGVVRVFWLVCLWLTS